MYYLNRGLSNNLLRRPVRIDNLFVDDSGPRISGKGLEMTARILKILLLAFSVLGLLLAAGCEFSTSVDYDQNADFSSFKTYAWSEQKHPEVSELVHKRIVQAVEVELQAKGLSQAESAPDLYVTYHGDDNEVMVLDTTHYGYRYGPGWYWGGGVGAYSTQVHTYKEGTLIIDIYKAAEKEMIWRGTVTGTISDNPQKNAKTIHKGVKKIFKKFPPPEKKK